MKDHKMTIESFTVSYSMDTYSNGNKSSHFVSAAVRCEPGLDPKDFNIAHLEMAMRVTAAVYQDAIARMNMAPDEAQSRLKEIRENFENIQAKALEKQAQSTGDK